MIANGKKVLALATLAIMLAGAFAWLPSVKAEAVEYLPFTVVFTAGMHGQIKPFDYKGQPNFGGFAKASTKINEIREELKNDKTWWENGGNVLTLDIGNSIMGSQTGWYFANTSLKEGEKHPVVAAMNTIKYDAMSFGASEFSLAPSVRERLKTQADFPWVNANVVVGKERSKLTDEYKMMVYKIPTAAHPLRYGIVGLVNPAVFSWEDPNNLTLGSSKLALDDYSEKAREHAESLKETGEKADFIIVTTDLGLEKNADGTWKENLLYQMIQEVTHVDFICSSSPGLSFQEEKFVVLEPSGKKHETLVCQLPQNGVVMGRMDFVLEKCTCPVKPYVFRKVNGLRQMKSRFVTLDQNVKPDQAVLDVLKPFEAQLKGKFDVRVGEVKCDINAATARLVDNPIAELACTVMMKETDADFAISDIWTTTASIKKGSFTFGDLFNLFPKDSKIYKITLTGQQLRDALAVAANVYHTERDTNLIIGKGFTYYLDTRPGTTTPVGNLMIGKTPIDMKKTYTLATNSYIALGQGGYNFKQSKVEATRKKLLDAIQNYIRDNNGELKCTVSKNWFVVPDYLDHWSKEYVDILMAKKMVSGDKYGRYLPDNSMTRAEASKMLLSIYDHPTASPAKATFKDLNNKHWAYGFVEGGAKMGMWFWLKDNFGPNANITREEVFANMVVTVGKKAQAEAVSAADIAEFEKNFADANDCSPWSKKYIAYATKTGLVGGILTDGKLYVKPRVNIRRGEVASIMTKARFPVVAIMATADFRTEVEQSRIDASTDRKVGGAYGLAATIGNLRSAYDKNVLVDAGGMLTGTAWAEFAGGKMATGFLTSMGYDAATLGIRDFYLGAGLKDRIANFPGKFVGANLTGLDVKKSIIKDVGGIKVGIIGAVDPDTTKFICEEDMGAAKISPIAAAINAEAKTLKSQGAEIIIVTASIPGYIELGKSAREGFKGPASQIAGQLSGVNAMFVSGSPMGYVAPTSTGLWVLAPNMGGSTIGLTKLRFDAKTRSIDNVDASLVPTYADLLDKDIKTSAKNLVSTVESFYNTQKNAMKSEVETVIGRTETGLSYDDSNESLLGDFITEYAADKLGVDFILFPSDHTFKSVAPGSITAKDIYQAMPVEDTWVKGKITGKKIGEICESSVSGERGVLQLWGLSFVFTRTKDPGNRISEKYIVKGEEKIEIDNNATYTFAVSARELYTLPSFGHEAIGKSGTEMKSACLYVRQGIIAHIKKLTEAGQPVNQLKRKHSFSEP